MKDWVAGTFDSYLNFRIAPLDASFADITQGHVIDLMAAAGLFRAEIAVAKAVLMEPYASIRDFVFAVVDCMGRVGQPTPQPPPTFEPVIGARLTGNADRPALATLSRQANKALAHLQNVRGRRAVLIWGEPHTGKKFVLQKLHSAGRKHGCLLLQDGTLLTILAMSLPEQTLDQLIEAAFNFYASADAGLRLVAPRQAPMSVDAQLEALREMAARIPACVMLADIDTVEDDEILRRLDGWRLTEILEILHRAHPSTRLVVTATRASWDAGPDWTMERIHVPSILPRNRIEGMPNSLSRHLGAAVEATGLSWALILSIERMARARGWPEERLREVGQRVTEYLHQPAALVQLLFDDVLAPREQAVVGLIASSNDGLRRTVLTRLRHSFDHCVSGQPSAADLDLASLQPLVTLHHTHVDRGLVICGEPEQETLLRVDDAWRRLVMERWWTTRPEQARLGMWLIAREAARQARLLRITEAATQRQSIHGRDVQALYSLLAAVGRTSASSGKSTNAAGDELLLERTVLPPPTEAWRTMPSPHVAIRFAFFQLYRADLEGNAHRLLTETEDARVRVGILLTFLRPDQPWLTLSKRTLSPRWEDHGQNHLASVLDPRERMALLASLAIAAQRILRGDIVSAAARLGEALVETHDIGSVSKIEFMRLLRAEVELGLLLGANPDAWKYPMIDPQPRTLAAVAERIGRILDKYFPNGEPSASDIPGLEGLQARGKMLARLGEVRHVMGELPSARDAFEAAYAIEQRILAFLPLATTVSPVFGGRGSRAVLRFQLDVGRRLLSTTAPFRPFGWEFFNFSDSLRLPERRRLTSDAAPVLLAARLLDENARRLNRSRPDDSLGVKIDAARLAVTQHDFARALLLLDVAVNERAGSDPSIETQLELAAVRTRFTLEAAMLCIRASQHTATFASHDALPPLRAYLKHSPHTTAMDMAKCLTRATSERLRHLDAVVKQIGEKVKDMVEDHHLPYGIYALYLRGLLHGLQSRLLDEPQGRLLQEAREELGQALDRMERGTYGMHLREARVISRYVGMAMPPFHAVRHEGT